MRNHIRFTLRSITIECLILLEKELSISNVKVKKKRWKWQKRLITFIFISEFGFPLPIFKAWNHFHGFFFFLGTSIKIQYVSRKSFHKFLFRNLQPGRENTLLYTEEPLWILYYFHFQLEFTFFGISRNLAFRSAVKREINCYALHLLIN